MRIVGHNDPVWRAGGIGSGDVAALMGVPAAKDEHGYFVFGQKCWTQESQRLKKVTLEQGTDTWLTWRNGGVGGSEVSALMGPSKFKDVSKLWKIKTGAEKEDSAENPDIARGKAQEPNARDRYEELFGWRTAAACIIHETHDYMRVSLDGIRETDDLIVEIKCPRDRGHGVNLDISREADPEHRQMRFRSAVPWYYAQTQYQLLVSEADVCHFVSFSPSWPERHEQMVVIDLYPDPSYQEELERRVHLFWQCVVDRSLPPIEMFSKYI